MSSLVFDTRVSLSEDMSAVGFYAMALHDEILHPRVHGLFSPQSPSSLALGPQEHLMYSVPCTSRESGLSYALLHEEPEAAMLISSDPSPLPTEPRVRDWMGKCLWCGLG